MIIKRVKGVMMLFLKEKIRKYLGQIKDYSIFDELLEKYISGNLYDNLQSWGLNKISIYVEFKEEYKNIDIQAKYHDYFYEWQFDENECSFMMYIDDEPDEATCLEYSMFESADEILLKMKSLVSIM